MTHKVCSIPVLILVVCAVCAAVPAAGSTLFYTNQTLFDTAAGSVNSFGFNSLVSGGGAVTYDTAAGLTLDGVNFVGNTGTAGNPYLLDADGPSYYFNDYNKVPGASSLAGPGVSNSFYDVTNGNITITMPSGGVTAFGLVLFDVLIGDTTGAGTDTVNLKVGGSTGSVVTPPTAGTAFLGFVSTTPITSVILTGTAPNEFPVISSVYFTDAAVTATPEPATLSLLCAAGIVGALGVILKRARS